MTLHALPDELLIFVLRQLESRNDLSNLALCSRRFHNLALPVLYSSFKDDGALLRTLPFLSTIVRRPDLVRYVKNVAIDGRDFALFPPGPFDEDWDPIEAALKRIFEDESLVRDWHHDLHHLANATIALAIILLPNLSNLTLTYYSSEVRANYITLVLSQLSRLQNSGLSTSSSLYRLHTLNLENFHRGATVWELFGSFQLLKSLRFVNCSDILIIYKCYANVILLRSPTSHITHLSLHRCNIDSRMLSILLTGCPDLTHLSYYHSNVNKAGDALRNPFNPPQIRKALICLRQSLQELVLLNLHEDSDEDDSEIRYDREEEEVSMPLGSLADFQQLCTLQTTLRILKGEADVPIQKEPETWLSSEEPVVHVADSLPDGLETLLLYRCTETIYGVMAMLFRRKEKGALKKLKRVKLLFHNGVADSLDESFSCVEEGKRVGIVVECRRTKLDHQNLPGWSS